MRTAFLSVFSLAAAITINGQPAAPKPATDRVDVQVLAILASDRHAEVHPRLVEFACHVRTHDPSLTGFRLERSTVDTLVPGETRVFDLADGQVVEVTVNAERNERGRILLTIKPPKHAQITYECACDKFFAMATQHRVGEEGEHLFLAVMAKPCRGQ